MQAFWKYGTEGRSYHPNFADAEATALQIAAGLRGNMDHRHFEDLEVRVEEVDAAIADADEAELRKHEMLTPRVIRPARQGIRGGSDLPIARVAFVRVDRFDEPERGRGITFDDAVAVTFEDLVEQTVEVARAFDGLRDATGKRGDRSTLSARFVSWASMTSPTRDDPCCAHGHCAARPLSERSSSDSYTGRAA